MKDKAGETEENFIETAVAASGWPLRYPAELLPLGV
jgi:hypothetical protein